MAGLVKEIDKAVGKNKSAKIAAVINFTGQPTDSYKKSIKEFGDKNEVKNVALTISADGTRFGVSKDADVTVLHYKGKKVKFNFAAKGDLSKDEVKKVVEGIDTILN